MSVFLNQYEKTVKKTGYGLSDELYAAVTKQHSTKTLSEIDAYIKSHQQNNDPYWSRNRMEYKILRERERNLFKKEGDEMKELLTSDRISNLTYSQLLPYYKLIVSNQHIYGDIPLTPIHDILDELSFKRFEQELRVKSPSTAARWLKGRINEGEFIGDKLNALAIEMENSEPEEIIYKRKLKNLQTKLSKAKTEGNKTKIAEIQDEIDRFKK